MSASRWHAIAAAALACAAAGCQKPATNEKPLTPVKAEAVKMVSTSVETRYSANIAPHRQVMLSFKTGGYIDKIHQVRGIDGRDRLVQEGDFVRQGTVLAQLRERDYQVKVNQAQAQLRQARASLEAARSQQAEAEAAYRQAQLEFERAKNLLASQSLTKAEYDAAKARFDGAGAKVAAAKGQVEALQAQIAGAEALVQETRISLEDCALKAPLDAVVMNRAIEIGALVGPGTPVFVLADSSSIKAVFGAPDTLVRSLKPGMVMTVQSEAIPGTRFQGRITSISPSADLKSRVFDVEVTLPNRRTEWRVGMIASVEVPGSTAQKQALVLPLTAIVRSKKNPEQYAVFVVEEERGRQIARLRDVRLGEAFGNGVAIMEGLAAGQHVITSGANLVTDGEPVQVVP